MNTNDYKASETHTEAPQSNEMEEIVKYPWMVFEDGKWLLSEVYKEKRLNDEIVWTRDNNPKKICSQSRRQYLKDLKKRYPWLNLEELKWRKRKLRNGKTIFWKND